MKNTIFVNPEDLETLEQYAACILIAGFSLNTLLQYQIIAMRKGLLDTEEEETSQTICWEIKRTLNLYKTQIEKVIERTGFDDKAALETLKKLAPELAKKKKGRPKKEKVNDENV